MKKTSLGELIANATSHGVGVLLAIAGLVILLVLSNTTMEYVASIIYGLSLLMLYVSSTLLHSFPDSMKRVLAVFRRLDHASIYLLISGTYTPFLIVLIGTTEAYILLGILWTLTIIGVTLKSIWIKKFQAVHITIYLLMGWSIMFLFEEVQLLLGTNLLWVVIGGLCYTVGVAFYISKFKYQHLVWHIFVLAGSIFHFVTIALIY